MENNANYDSIKATFLVEDQTGRTFNLKPEKRRYFKGSNWAFKDSKQGINGSFKDFKVCKFKQSVTVKACFETEKYLSHQVVQK